MEAIDNIIAQGYSIDDKYQKDDTSFDNDEIKIENNSLLVTVMYDDEVVGEAEFSDSKESFHCENVRVHECCRRRGIATAMYVKAELIIGKTLDNHWDGTTTQKDEARALWANPNRPFGRR